MKQIRRLNHHASTCVTHSLKRARSACDAPRGLKPAARSGFAARRRCGFTLAETLISIVLVGGLLVAALNVVGAATVGQQTIGNRSRGQLLAMDLMSEILGTSYAELDANAGLETVSKGSLTLVPGGSLATTPVLGPDSGEDDGTRANFDDVDDYHGWSASPPQMRDGTEMTNLVGWQRSVTVEYVAPNDVSAKVGSEQYVKRITVTVTHNAVIVGQLVAIRTAVFQFE